MLHDIFALLKSACHVRERGSIENTCGYSGTSKNIGPNMALEQCRKGNHTAGIGEPRQILSKEQDHCAALANGDGQIIRRRARTRNGAVRKGRPFSCTGSAPSRQRLRYCRPFTAGHLVGMFRRVAAGNGRFVV